MCEMIRGTRRMGKQDDKTWGWGYQKDAKTSGNMYEIIGVTRRMDGRWDTCMTF